MDEYRRDQAPPFTVPYEQVDACELFVHPHLRENGEGTDQIQDQVDGYNNRNDRVFLQELREAFRPNKHGSSSSKRMVVLILSLM